MSTRSNSSNLFSPLRDPESLIRQRNLGEPSSLFDFEEVMSIPHNNMGSPPTGPPSCRPPPPNNNGPPPMGSLPSNTVANPRGNVKVITTRSGVAYNGPTILPTPSPPPKEVECETKETKDKVKNTSLGSTAHVQPPIVQDPIPEPEVAKNVAEKLGDPRQVFNPMTLFSCSKLDYDVDPRVPLIPGRHFLRTTRALIDVYGEELTLRVDDEAITFKVGQTLRYSGSYETVNQVNVIDVAWEEYAQEVLGFSDSSSSGNPTPSDPIIASYSPSVTPFEGGDFILEEIETFLRTPEELF
ncbi:hypothetical protein Tco_0465221 [Tanacetum coccineum]